MKSLFEAVILTSLGVILASLFWNLVIMKVVTTSPFSLKEVFSVIIGIVILAVSLKIAPPE